MTERTFSMSAGLAASTVTPGITAPDVSRTTPAIFPESAWAHAVAGSRMHPTNTSHGDLTIVPPFQTCHGVNATTQGANKTLLLCISQGDSWCSGDCGSGFLGYILRAILFDVSLSRCWRSQLGSAFSSR